MMKAEMRKGAGRAAAVGIAAILMAGALPLAGNLPETQLTADLSNAYTVSAGSVVYYAYHSKCYHVYRGCRTLRRSRTVYKTTLRSARAKGLRPCRVCTR
ncbi:MAG: hypothetical protein ACI4W2_06640 [Eubacterium sp.]